MTSLSALPTESKSNIASMVAGADAAFNKRRLTAGIAHFRDTTPWHGRGAKALFQVSKEWSALMAPFLFETVRATKTFHPTFRYHIMRRHAHGIRHLVLDDSVEHIFESDSDDGITFISTQHTYLPHITLIAPLAFPRLTTITMCEAFSTALQLCLFANSEYEVEEDGLALAAFKELVRPLTTLRFDKNYQPHIDGLDLILPLFPNITSLSGDMSGLWRKERLDTASLEAITRLVHLDHLQITSYHPFYTLPDWNTLRLPTIRSVDISFETLSRDKWKLVATFGSNASQLVLRAAFVADSYQLPPHSFPNLGHLSILLLPHSARPITPTGPTNPRHRDLFNPILRGIASAPLLHTVHLHLHSYYLPRRLHAPSPSAKIIVFLEDCPVREVGDEREPRRDDGPSVEIVRRLGPNLDYWDRYPIARVSEESRPSERNSTASGMLRRALVLAEQHRATKDEVGSGRLIRALEGLRSLLKLERD